MKLFFDTSALVKFFYEEKGSDIVTDLITSKQNEIWLLELLRSPYDLIQLFSKSCMDSD